MHLREEKKWGKDNGFGFQNKTETERHSKSDLREHSKTGLSCV
jgi:hypothetical protein